uniref:Carbamoyltransferase n=1 Tax=Candidatus Kentrum sp. DK TaxID=2126562 RepID=A0A450SR68_9GAMM|nr:MAG: carbamoyltransferase [Candidatus Kentron sp. DK]
MKILGINSGRAVPPRFDPGFVRKLSDGSAALVQNGRIRCAAIEERFTRVRYSNGYRHSGLACLSRAGIAIDTLDAVAHSTCCDSVWSESTDILEDIAETWEGIFPRERIFKALEGKVFTVDHHQSHATLAFAGSGFDKAIVLVIDGFGNRLNHPESFDPSPNWWKGAFERQTYFLCEWRHGRIHFEVLHEDAHGPNEIGLGEVYRSVTHALGWHTYQHAGKTMALAPFGNPEHLQRSRLIESVLPHSSRVPIRNLHNDPISQIGQVIAAAGYALPDTFGICTGNPNEPFLCDVAALVQHQLETALINTISGLMEEHGIKNIAFGGGVAMNCVALGKLHRARPDIKLYIPPAPADTGQALGNALWLAYADRSPITESAPSVPIRSAALGISYTRAETDRAVSGFLKNNHDVKAVRISEPKALASAIVERLLQGKVVGLRQGRAEYGPRALGQASILADARSREMHDIVNSFKKREPFRPYAPSILAENVEEFLDIGAHSPFMSIAGIFRRGKGQTVPAVVHVDGSARYQSVDRDIGFYRLLLETYYRRTGIPIVLNTSFNLNGEPIVETPEDALDCFQRAGMTDLVVGDWYLQHF